MKIAVNTRLLRKNKMDGIGVFTHEIFSRLVKNHPEHTFYFFFDQKPHGDFIYAENVVPEVILPPTKTPLLYNLWFQYQLPRKLKKLNADIFISPDGNIPLNINIKTVNVIHDLNFEHYPDFLPGKWRKYYRKKFPEFARKSTRLITVSEYSKNDIVQTYGISADKIDIVPNAAADFFHPLNDEQKRSVQKEFTQGKPYFIFVGSLHPRKNINNLLLAFDHLKKRYDLPHKLVLAGNKMWWTSEMETTWQNMQFKDEVIFTGRVSNEKLNHLLAASEGLVYIPVFEGFGIPLLEAFRCEVPVIYSNVTSLPEVAQGAGIAVQPGNIEEISDAMYILATDKQKSAALIEKGKTRLTHFSWNKSAEKMWNIIEKTALC